MGLSGNVYPRLLLTTNSTQYNAKVVAVQTAAAWSKFRERVAALRERAKN